MMMATRTRLANNNNKSLLAVFFAIFCWFKIVVAIFINGERSTLTNETYCVGSVTNGLLSVISVVTCHDLLNDSLKLTDDKTYLPGTVVQLVCDPGYRIVNGEGFSVCLADGMWLPLIGSCERAVTCDPLPPFILNGGIESQSESSWAPDSSINFVPGSWVKYRCDYGYHLKGTAKLVCADSGHWSNPPPECAMTRDLFSAASAYWMSPRQPTRFEACGDASAANVVMADPADPSQALIVCWSGEITALNVDCSTVNWRSNVLLPSNVHGGIWYAAIDGNQQRAYFSLAAKDGIFWADMTSLYAGGAVELKYFVDGAIEKRSYYGIAIDSIGRVLYCCDPYSDMSIGVWSLETGHMLGKIAKPSVLSVFQPSNVALSPHLLDAGYQLLAVSDWNNDLVHLFRATIDHEHKSFISFISTVANGSLSTAGEPPLGNVLGPSGLFFDAANNLIVADNLNTRIQVFIPEFGRRKPLIYHASWSFSDLGSGASSVTTLVDNGKTSIRRDLGRRKDAEYSNIPRPVLITGLESGEVVCLK